MFVLCTQAIGVGAKIGIEECQHQFRMSRWNCTTYHNTTSIFGGILSVSTYVPHRVNRPSVFFLFFYFYCINTQCSPYGLPGCTYRAVFFNLKLYSNIFTTGLDFKKYEYLLSLYVQYSLLYSTYIAL
jgi:hypothetical protein